MTVKELIEELSKYESSFIVKYIIYLGSGVAMTDNLDNFEIGCDEVDGNIFIVTGSKEI